MRKDESLDTLAGLGNVAQFVAFAPDANGDLIQTYSRIAGREANAIFASAAEAIAHLLDASPEASVNLRSFEPMNPRSREFIYGIKSLSEAVASAKRLAREGLHVIVNETIDVCDGGVSGVLHGDVIEFAPDDTPRCVEKPGVASLPRNWGLSLLQTVYGATPDGDLAREGRLEFSIHPGRRGYRKSHVLAWEFERSPLPGVHPQMVWPNRFSRHIGDKAYGLLVADKIGLPVPKTTVIGRRVAPFSFGSETGSVEVWIRTCPVEQEPGRYTTRKGWIDPYKLMHQEDPSNSLIASVLCQAAVQAVFSGAAIVSAAGELIIEGRAGEGDSLMLGTVVPEALPAEIVADVRAVYEFACHRLGPVRFEWVHDGNKVWVVQLHVGATLSDRTVIVPGEAEAWATFDVGSGLPALRLFLAELPLDTGILLEGQIGLTSHLADLIRKSRRPAVIADR